MRLVWIGVLFLLVVDVHGALRAGAARVDVTPEKLPVIVNCFMTERTIDKVTNRLYARALVLSDGAMRLAIAVVDSCMMPRELLDRAKQLVEERTGIARDRILISATHTHFAPAVMGCLGSDAQTDYAEWLTGKIAEAIIQAAAALVPARAGWAVEDDYEHTHCRRWIYRPGKMLRDPFGDLTVRANMHPGYQNPDAILPSGPVDPALTVLSVQTAAGRPLALLANYSQHYFGDSPLSPDYFGLFAAGIARKMNAADGFVAMMSQGTSGDQMWMDYSQPKSNITIEQYADGVVETAYRALARIRYKDNLPLGMAESVLRLKRRTPSAQRLSWARDMVQQLGDRKPRTQPEIYAREQIFLHDEPERELKLQAVRIGDLAITAIPDEVFAITGLKLKLRSPFATTMNIELANGAEGYIPPPEQHRLGGYTTWPARTAGLEVQAEPQIVEALLVLLEKLAGKPRRAPTEPRSAYSDAVMAAKPTAYWSLGEMDGSTAFDRITKHEASYQNDVAFFLDGPPLRGAAANRAPYLAGGSLLLPMKVERGTVEFWFWVGAPGAVLKLGDLTLTVDKKLQLGATSGRSDVTPKRWHHLAVVLDAGKAAVYLNGAMELSAEIERGGTVAIGGGFDGKIDEVAIYDKPLSMSQILKRHSTRKQ